MINLSDSKISYHDIMTVIEQFDDAESKNMTYFILFFHKLFYRIFQGEQTDSIVNPTVVRHHVVSPPLISPFRSPDVIVDYLD